MHARFSSTALLADASEMADFVQRFDVVSHKTHVSGSSTGRISSHRGLFMMPPVPVPPSRQISLQRSRSVWVSAWMLKESFAITSVCLYLHFESHEGDKSIWDTFVIRCVVVAETVTASAKGGQICKQQRLQKCFLMLR